MLLTFCATGATPALLMTPSSLILLLLPNQNALLKALCTGGTLVTCSCSHHVSLAEFQEVVAAAAGDAGRRVRLIERRGAAHDHPVILTVPETEYLKCLICYVE